MKSLQKYSATVKASLTEKKMKQKDLAKKLGMDPAVLSRKMKSPGTFRLDEMWLIQLVLGWETLEG